MNRFMDVSNSLWTGSKHNNFLIKNSKEVNDTNINYIMSYMTCEYKHNAIKPLKPNQNINLQVLGSHEYINSSTTKFRIFLT
jgi:hypothetical protein